MSGCLTVGGTVTADPPSSCAGYVVMSPAEYTAWLQPQLQTREQNFSDGIALGWQVSLLVIAAWCFVMIRRAMQ